MKPSICRREIVLSAFVAAFSFLLFQPNADAAANTTGGDVYVFDFSEIKAVNNFFPETKDGYAFLGISTETISGTINILVHQPEREVQLYFKTPGEAKATAVYGTVNADGTETPKASETWTAKAVVVKGIAISDSNGRSSGMQAIPELEIVAPKNGEDINGTAAILPDSSLLPLNWPEWNFNDNKQTGTSVTFKKGATGLFANKIILKDVQRQIMLMDCEGNKALVAVYPYDIGIIKYTTDGFTTSFFNSLIDALTVLIPLADVSAKFPQISFDIENQWKEQKDTNLCGWTFHSDVTANLLKKTVKLGFTTSALKKIQKYIDEYFEGDKILNKYVKKYIAGITLPKVNVGLSTNLSDNVVFNRDEYGKNTAVGQYDGSNAEIKGEIKAGVELLPEAENFFKIKVSGAVTGGWQFSGNPYIDDNKWGQKLNAEIKPIEIQFLLIIKTFGVDFGELIPNQGEFGPYEILPRKKVIDNATLFEYRW